VVLGELHAGFVLGARREKKFRELSRFLDQPGCRIAGIGAELAERYGELVRVLRRQGTPIPTNDLWVAAVALHTAATVVTLDHHFAQIPLLPVAP
jgi:tRNA(fMet)-specific endonuclease VapC